MPNTCSVGFCKSSYKKRKTHSRKQPCILLSFQETRAHKTENYFITPSETHNYPTRFVCDDNWAAAFQHKKSTSKRLTQYNGYKIWNELPFEILYYKKSRNSFFLLKKAPWLTLIRWFSWLNNLWCWIYTYAVVLGQLFSNWSNRLLFSNII